MTKRDRKLVKKAVERKTPFRGFTKLKPAWDFLLGHRALDPFPSHLSVNLVKGDKGTMLVVVSIPLRGDLSILCQGKTFEEAVIKLANLVLEKYGDGKNDPPDPALRTIAEVYSKL